MSKNTLAAGRRETRAHSNDARIVRVRTERNGSVFKTLGVCFLIFLQLGLLLTLYSLYLLIFQSYVIVSLTLSLLSVVHVLSSDKNGQAKAIWTLFLVAGFTIGFIVYILSSEKIFFGKQKKRYNKIFERTKQYTPEYALNTALPQKVCNDAEYLNRAGGFVTYGNSQVKYFPSGAQLFDDILDSAKTAEKFIFLEYFIVADGILLDRLCNVLFEKAKAGVDIRIIVDGIGSHRPLSHKMRKTMRKNGIKLYSFNRFLPRFTFALNLRDHRKIAVIDGKTAYTGGCNLADEYVNEKRLHGYWKDNGVRVRGGAVDGLTLTFLRQWEFVTKKSEDYAPYLGLAAKFDNGSAVTPYADGKDYKHNIVRGLYTNIMTGAEKKLYLMSPYFVPDDEVINLLACKALSGVDVRLVLPGVPDKAYVYALTLDNARKLEECGVKVILMKQGFVHSKVVFSENCVSVGSANLDLRSYYNQFENGVYTNDPAFMAEVERDFENTVTVSEELNRRLVRNPFRSKLVTGFLRLFSPLM